MLRSGGAAIPMRQSFPELQFIIGNEKTIEQMPDLRPLQPFDDLVLAFFNDLASVLMKNRKYSDVATFGFWCRKAALLQARHLSCLRRPRVRKLRLLLQK